MGPTGPMDSGRWRRTFRQALGNPMLSFPTPRRRRPLLRYGVRTAHSTGDVMMITLRLLGAFLMAALLSAAPARAAEETVTLNFVNADIEAVVKAVAEMTGRNFVLDPKVDVTINMIFAGHVQGSL